METKIKQEIEKLQKQIDDLKKEINYKEKEYPKYFKKIGCSLVVRFDSLHSGEVVVRNTEYKEGYAMVFLKFKENEWQELKVCPETGFFDGQLVWRTDNKDYFYRTICFYDAINKCSFKLNGERNGCEYKHYEPFVGNYPEWAVEFFKKLEF